MADDFDEQPVTLICQPRASLQVDVAGSVDRPCETCNTPVVLAPSGQVEAAKTGRRILCLRCAKAEMATNGGEQVTVRNMTTEQVREVMRAIGPEKLFELMGITGTVIDVIVAEGVEDGPPPGYHGLKVGETVERDGRTFICVGVERSEHECDLGTLCSGAWRPQLIAEDSFRR